MKIGSRAVGFGERDPDGIRRHRFAHKNTDGQGFLEDIAHSVSRVLSQTVRQQERAFEILLPQVSSV